MSISTRTADTVAMPFMRGGELAAKARYSEALRCFDKVLAKAPGALDAINNRANCLLLLGRNHEAIADYSKVLLARPNDARALNNRANSFKQVGRFTEALVETDDGAGSTPGANHSRRQLFAKASKAASRLSA